MLLHPIKIQLGAQYFHHFQVILKRTVIHHKYGGLSFLAAGDCSDCLLIQTRLFCETGKEELPFIADLQLIKGIVYL